MSSAPTEADEAWGPIHSGRRWSSGRWSLEIRADELADIRCDGEPMLRGVRMVSRDVDWNTAWPREISTRPGQDELELDLLIDDLGISLRATLTVRSRGDALEISVEAEARTDMRTNRTGLVLLHPPRLAGEELLVGHTDRRETSLRFPIAISPHQPAREISSLTWRDGDRRFQAEFDGDEFEMEDQRNWSDASYKTYNRSLDEPFPYLVRAGERIRQRITLTALPEVALLDLAPAGAVPTIAVGASTAPDPAPTPSDPVTAHRHVELELTDPAWPAALERARLGARDLSVMLVSPSPADPAVLEAVAQRLTGIALRWVAVVDDASHVSEPGLVAALRAALPAGVPVVGGSRSHFTEVNREAGRIPLGELEGLVFPITPLFHTPETEQLIESVAMQRVIAADATSQMPDLPVHIGPITLRPRFDNVATTPPPPPSRTDLAEGYGAQRTGRSDPRQASSQLAAWTIASAAALALPGIASLTYFEEWGPRGIRAADGTDLPVRAALSALTALEGGRLLTASSPDGWLWALGARWDDPHGSVDAPQEVLVANLSGRPRTLRVSVEGRPERQLELGAFGWTRLSGSAVPSRP